MSETIHYAAGKSSLGDFVAAMSERGLVAFEFGERDTLVDALKERLPEASIEEDTPGLADIVGMLAVLVDDPHIDPGIAVDPRGTAYQKRVWELLCEIPAGETTSYGALAAKLGTRDARDVTEAIAANTIAILIPCHRVVKKDGSPSGYRWGFARKRTLLGREKRVAAVA